MIGATLILSCISASAQHIVKGKVADSVTKEPEPGAVVQVFAGEAKNENLAGYALSDSLGCFSIKLRTITEADYFLKVINMGRITEEREHPRLDVRHWSGRSPVKMVLSSQHGIDAIIGECVERNLQSLLVEGGRQTLMSFIEAGLWDKIRMEHGQVITKGGTPAPGVPPQAILQSREDVDGNVIEWFTFDQSQQESRPTAPSPT